MSLRLVRHFEKNFPVEGVYIGYYSGDCAVFMIKNSTVVEVNTRETSIYYPKGIDKNKVEVILKS